MSELRVRRASTQDSAAIAALAIQVFLDTYATEGISEHLANEAFETYSESAFAIRLAEPSRAFLLAESGEHITAFAEVLCTDRPCPLGDPSGAELVRLYVQPRMQCRGTGRMLLKEAERLALSCSLSYQWLTAWDGNDRALAFYQRCGYSDIGATTYSFGGKVFGNRVLAKQLAAAAA